MGIGFGGGALTGAIIGSFVGGPSFSGPGSSMLGRSFGKLGKIVENPGLKVDFTNLSDYAMRRMAQREISKGLVNATVRNGVTLLQSTGRYLFLTPQAAVVTSAVGKLITTYSSADYDQAMQEIIRIIFGG